MRDMGLLLKEHPFFQDMGKAARETIAGCGRNEVFEAGRYLFHEGGAADSFYLVRHGAVAVELHVPGKDPVVLETLHSGETVGWSWLIPPYKWSLDARAVELTRVVVLDAKCLRGKMEKECALAYELYKRFVPVMAGQLLAARFRLTDVYGNPER
ncbi:MAG: cyclic nucleotide-binding domain-containing protein [Alphaproteobacteria bacterium]|nr:cyclic nucleotide-binding domain-containing protein [Alphaproteobacteria bacterium]